jgi:uncharacterized protein (TIGR02147 family)
MNASGSERYIWNTDMPQPQTLPSPFEYTDYRRFLGDWFEARRRTDSGFSLRAFALKAGLPISNSSFFSKVIAGKRNLTLDLQFRIAKALKLTAPEIKHFSLMVQMAQSKDPEGKRHLFAELSGHAKSKAKVLGAEAQDFYSGWQNAIIRAYFGLDQKENNPASIGRKVFPPIPGPKVAESIRLLLDLGLISKTANGYALRDRNIAADHLSKDSVGRLRIQEMLRLAAEVFPRLPAADRDFSAMTIYVGKQGIQAIKERIRAFREDVKSLVEADKSEDRIYTLAMQLFPNARLPEWGDEEGKP